MIEEFSI